MRSPCALTTLVGKVMLKVVAVVFQGVKGFIFNFPAYPCSTHQQYQVVLSDIDICT